jgi:hypothetical protein
VSSKRAILSADDTRVHVFCQEAVLTQRIRSLPRVHFILSDQRVRCLVGAGRRQGSGGPGPGEGGWYSKGASSLAGSLGQRNACAPEMVSICPTSPGCSANGLELHDVASRRRPASSPKSPMLPGQLLVRMKPSSAWMVKACRHLGCPGAATRWENCCAPAVAKAYGSPCGGRIWMVAEVVNWPQSS